jgi:paraquat-inducible protein B
MSNFSQEYIYLIVKDGELKVFSDLFSLEYATGTQKYDVKVLASEYTKARLNSNGDIEIGYTLEEAREKKYSELTLKLEEEYRKLSPYSSKETATFDAQYKGALDYLDGKSSSEISILEAISTVRNISMSELATNIITHRNQYNSDLAKLMGKYKKLITQLYSDNITTPKAVNSVVWED